LSYLIDGERCAVIAEDIDITLARQQVGVAGVFIGGDRIDEGARQMIPPSHIGRLIRPTELAELLRIISTPSKKPPAKSIAARARSERRRG
jgi:hypothetical protein